MSIRSFKLALTGDNGNQADIAVLRDWTERLPPRLKDVSRIELDVLDSEGQETHQTTSSRAAGAPFVAIISLWASTFPESGPDGYRMSVIEVADRIGYGFENDALGPVDGYKKLTFWKAKSGIARETWDSLYAHHIVTVPHLQPIWRYRQNIIVSKPTGFPFDAISENWWKTLHDLSAGFFFSEEKKKVVYEETRQFIDLDVTASFVGRNEVVYVDSA